MEIKPYLTLSAHGFHISTESKNLLKACSNVKRQLPSLRRDVKGYQSYYADINQVMEVLEPIIDQNGIEIFQPLIKTPEGNDGIMTYITHLETGEFLSFTSGLIYEIKDRNDWGGGVTYTRRYEIVSFFGMEQKDDDDGRGAKANLPAETPPKRIPITDQHIEELEDGIRSAENPAMLLAEIYKETRINGLKELSDKQFYFVRKNFLTR